MDISYDTILSELKDVLKILHTQVLEKNNEIKKLNAQISRIFEIRDTSKFMLMCVDAINFEETSALFNDYPPISSTSPAPPTISYEAIFPQLGCAKIASSLT